jgi:hypothetical protein
MSIEAKGVYYSNGVTLYLDTNTAYYLVRHENMKFITTNSTEMMNLQGAIRINIGNALPFLIGRMFNLTYSNVMLGKVKE